MKCRLKEAFARADVERDMRVVWDGLGLPDDDYAAVLERHRQLCKDQDFYLITVATRMTLEVYDRMANRARSDDPIERRRIEDDLHREAVEYYVRLILAMLRIYA